MRLEGWMDDYFFKALEWVDLQDAAVVQTTRAGVVLAALSHFHGVTSKAEWVCAAVRGFGANLVHTKRAELAKLLARAVRRARRSVASPTPGRAEGRADGLAGHAAAPARGRRFRAGPGRPKQEEVQGV